MKTKAIIVDVHEVDGNKNHPYGGYRIFVFDQESHNVIKNYLGSFGVDDVEAYSDEYVIGGHYCSIVADRIINKACADTFAVILDKTLYLKADRDNYQDISYTGWVNSVIDIDAFMED